MKKELHIFALTVAILALLMQYARIRAYEKLISYSVNNCDTDYVCYQNTLSSFCYVHGIELDAKREEPMEKKIKIKGVPIDKIEWGQKND